jgi:hypothetical protein
MQRRGFLAGILAAGFAPAAIGSGVLMPVRKIATIRAQDLVHSGITSTSIHANSIHFSKIDTRRLIIRDEKGNVIFSSSYEYTGLASFSNEANRGIKSLSLDPPSFQAIQITEHRA